MTLRDVKRPHYTQEDRTAKQSVLHKAARWYVKHGYAVFPLAPGTKKPLYGSNGLDDATTDLPQIDQWWTENPCYNIGINAGASGLLVVDGDTYKDGAGRLDLPPTVKANTAHHGTHYWYRMPEGKRYGNSTGTLPKWLDIRGFGGYVVAPPSVLIEDGQQLPYTFVSGCKPTEIEVSDLPADIAVVLEDAQTSRDAADVHFSEYIGAAPDLSQWPLSTEILDLIRNGHPIGADRSSHDQKVITALIYAGASDDDIRAVFVYFPIGAKYKEKGRSGDKYLARSIGKAHVYVEDHPPDPPPSSTLLSDLHALRAWAQGAEFTEMLREHKITRPADYAKTMIAIVNRAIQRGAPRVRLGSYQLGEMINASHMTAKRHLDMFGDGITTNHSDGTVTHRPGLKLVTITDDPDGYGKWVDLTELLRSVNPINFTSSVLEVNTSQQFANDHLQDEAFVLYPHHLAILMRPDAQILQHGLSAAALFIAATLSEYNELTRAAICQLTGLSQYTVGKMLRRMDDMGLLVVWEGRPYRYSIHPNFEGVLDDLRPLLPSYNITKRRGHVNAAARITFINRQLNAPEAPEPRVEAKLKDKQKKYEEQKIELADAAAASGMDITIKLGEYRAPKAKVAHCEHLDRLRTLVLTGERAHHRSKRRGYKPKRPNVSIFAADAEWGDLNAWAVMTYGVGWWIRRDINGVLQAYEQYLAAEEYIPNIHWDDSQAVAA